MGSKSEKICIIVHNKIKGLCKFGHVYFYTSFGNSFNLYLKMEKTSKYITESSSPNLAFKEINILDDLGISDLIYICMYYQKPFSILIFPQLNALLAHLVSYRLRVKNLLLHACYNVTEIFLNSSFFSMKSDSDIPLLSALDF